MARHATIEELLALYLKGSISRRRFVTRLAMLGLSTPAIASLLAACRRAEEGTPAPIVGTPPSGTAVTGATPSPAPSGAAKRGGTITWADYEPNTLNPYIASEAIARSVIALVNRGLVGVNPNGEVFPVLVTEIPSKENGGLSDDGKVVTWRLKPGLKWSDGQPLTSDDIKFTWEAVSHPESTATQTQGFDLIERIETPDELTAVVYYKQFWAPWVTQFALGILPRHGTGDPSQMGSWEWNRTVNPTNGPFVLEEWQAADHMTFVRNEYWHEEGKPYLDRIFYPITTELEVQRQMLRTGENDMHHWLADDYVDEVKSWPNVTVKEGPSPYWFRVQFNLTDQGNLNKPHPILGDVRVRRALGLALDRQKILAHWKKVQFMSSMFRGPFACDLPPYEYNPEKAKTLLEEAGWVDQDGDGIREAHGALYAPDGTKLSLRLSSYTGWNREDEQVVMVEMWKAIGVEAKIQNYEPTVLYGTWGEGSPARRGDFDILWWDYELGLDPQVKAEDFYASWRIPSEQNPGGFNCTRVNDPEIDEWLRIAGSTTDIQVRRDAYCKIAKKIQEEIVNEWVFGVGYAFSASSARVKGWEMNEAYTPFAIFGWDAENWYIEE